MQYEPFHCFQHEYKIVNALALSQTIPGPGHTNALISTYYDVSIIITVIMILYELNAMHCVNSTVITYVAGRCSRSLSMDASREE